MAAFGVEIEETKELMDYVLKTNERLSSENLVLNSFKGRIVGYDDFLAIYIKPVYANFPFYAVFLLFGLSLLLGFKKYLFIPMLIFIMLSFFWSNFFYYLMFKLGLKKVNYKGKAKYLKREETLRRLIYYGSKGCP